MAVVVESGAPPVGVDGASVAMEATAAVVVAREVGQMQQQMPYIPPPVPVASVPVVAPPSPFAPELDTLGGRVGDALGSWIGSNFDDIDWSEFDLPADGDKVEDKPKNPEGVLVVDSVQMAAEALDERHRAPSAPPGSDVHDRTPPPPPAGPPPPQRRVRSESEDDEWMPPAASSSSEEEEEEEEEGGGCVTEPASADEEERVIKTATCDEEEFSALLGLVAQYSKRMHYLQGSMLQAGVKKSASAGTDTQTRQLAQRLQGGKVAKNSKPFCKYCRDNYVSWKNCQFDGVNPCLRCKNAKKPRACVPAGADRRTARGLRGTNKGDATSGAISGTRKNRQVQQMQAAAKRKAAREAAKK